MKFCNAVGLNPAKLITINQIHSTNVISPKNPGNYDSSDGIINFGGDLVCSIKVADCLPIFFVNNISKTIGVIHAGWRGISSGIIEEYINKIKLNGENISDNYVFIGPSIQQCCFKIQNDVLLHFDSTFVSRLDKIHFKVDLQNWAISQLLKLKINKDKVFVSNNCTYCCVEKYDSYRRDGANSGRMYAVLGWKV
tara:strand:- start:455 stop:1039 length:585 start_codon:yes stop_codon:yes gene_type:complete